MQENSDVTVMSRCDSLFSACLQVRLEATVWQKFKDNALQMEGEGWRGGGGVEGRGRGGGEGEGWTGRRYEGGKWNRKRKRSDGRKGESYQEESGGR